MTGGGISGYEVRFTGHVQGVGFRVTAVACAQGLAVDGWVRNEPDGSVRMQVDAAPADFKELIRRIESEMAGKIDQTAVDPRPRFGHANGLVIQR